MHLGLHHIDGAGRAVDAAAFGADVAQGDEVGDEGIHDAFRSLAAVFQQHGLGLHQVAHIAHQQGGTALQGLGLAVRRGDVLVTIEAAGQRLAALLEGFFQIAVHQAEPVGVGVDLVGAVNGGDGIFKVHNGGERGFHQDVGDTGGIGRAHIGGAVNQDLDVQAVLLEQHAVGVVRQAGEAREQGRVLQGRRERAVDDLVARHILVGA